MITNLIVLVAELSPEEIGRYGGRFFIGMLLFAGLVKCLQISKRPETSTICVASLACVLVAWLLSVIVQAFDPNRLWLAVFAIFFAILLIASLVLGITGLVDYRRHSGMYQQGKSQAIWGILLSGLILVVVVSSVVVAASKEDTELAELIEESPSRDVGSESYQDLNFRISKPSNKWVTISAKALNPVASVAFMRRDPQVWFVLIAEKLGIDNATNNELLMEIAAGNLRAATSQNKIGPHRAETHGGVEGLRFDADAQVNGLAIRYSYWVATHNGYAYQLIAWGQKSDAAELRLAAVEVCDTFQLIDKDRIAYSAGVEPVEVKRSPEWGYEVDFSKDSGWVSVSPVDAGFPMGDLVATKQVDGDTVSFAVFPLKLPDTETPTNVLLSAMAANQFSVGSRDKVFRNTQPNSVGSYPGSEAFGVEGSDYRYRMHLLTANGHAYLFAAWSSPSSTYVEEPIGDILASIRLFPPQSKPANVSELSNADTCLMLNDIGIAEYEKGNYESAAEYFQLGLEYHLDVNVAENLVRAYLHNRKLAAAEEALQEYLPKFPEEFELRSLQAALHEERNEIDEAIAAYAKLFLDGYDDEDQLLAFLNLAVAEEQYEQAIEVTKKLLEHNSSPRVKRWYASLHSHYGKHEEALKLIRELADQDQRDSDVQFTLGEILENAEHYSEALSVCDSLLTQQPNDINVLLLKGRCELELKKYPQAQLSFNKVLEQDSQNEEAQQFTQLLAGLMGKGDRSQISTLVEPVAIPPNVLAMMQEAESMSPHETESDYDAVEIYQVTGIAYQQDVVQKKTIYRKLRVATAAGVDSFSTLTRGFDPLTERLYVNRLAVYDSDGNLVAEGAQEDYYVLDDSDSDLASQDRRAYVPVPSLKPGSTIELVTTVELLSSTDEFTFERQFLASINPMRLGLIYYQGDTESIEHVSSKVSAESAAPDILLWSVQYPTVFELESQQASFSDFVPNVQIAPKSGTWETLGKEYLERIQPKLQLDPEIEAMAKSIAGELPSKREKIVALAKHVQAECTYKAIEFGVRSRIPNTALQVERNGYGDCKDHSVLLMQMLRSVDVDAQLALVNSGEPVLEEMPTLDQFNHMIVYIPRSSPQDREWFLDATEKYTAPMVPYTSGLANKRVLVLDPLKPWLAQTPKYGELAAQILVDRKVTFQTTQQADLSNVSLAETLTFNAYASSGLRGYLQSFSAREQRSAINDLLSEVAKVRLRKLKIDNLHEPTKDLVLHIECDYPNAFHVLGGTENNRTLVGPIPAIWEQYLLDLEFDEHRMTPFQLTVPLVIESQTEFKLPPGGRLVNLSQHNVTSESKYLDINTSVEQNGDRFIFKSQARRKTGFFEADQFARYYDVVQQAVSALRKPVRLRLEAVPAVQ